MAEHAKLGTHLSHCNFGEYVGSCKYCDEDCPALSEQWSWFGKNVQKSDKIVIELRKWLKTHAGSAYTHPLANGLWQEINEIANRFDNYNEFVMKIPSDNPIEILLSSFEKSNGKNETDKLRVEVARIIPKHLYD